MSDSARGAAQARALCVVLSSCAAFAVLVAAGRYGETVFGRSGFVKTGMPAQPPLPSGYLASEFWGAALMTCALPLSAVPAVVGVGESFSARALPAWVRVILLAGWTALFAWLAWFAYNDWIGFDLLDCALVGCAWSKRRPLVNELTSLPHGFYPTLGVVAFLCCALLGALSGALAAGLCVASCCAGAAQGGAAGASGEAELPLLSAAEGSRGGAPRPPGAAVRGPRAWRKGVALLGGALLPLCFIVLSGLLPSTWLHMTSAKIRTEAAQDVQTEAHMCRVAAIAGSLPPLLAFQRHSCPELPGAYFRTVSAELRAANRTRGHEQDRVVLKVHADVLIFYGIIYALVLLGALSSTSRSARALLHARARVPLPQWWCWGRGAGARGGKRGAGEQRRCYAEAPSLVQALAAASVLGGSALFSLHWWHDHNWHSFWPHTLPFVKAPSAAEKLARTSGQVSNLIVGLLALPTARASIWAELFDTPWERLLRAHVWLGYAFLACSALHAAAWWVVFGEQGVFPHDAFAVNMYFPLNFHAKPGNCSWLSCLDPEYQKPAADNWTIPLANLFMLFLGFPVFGLLTLNAVRRANFELFYYSHHAFLALFAVLLWHAPSSWFFLALGLSLWVLDRVLRFASGVQRVELLHVVPHDARLTELRFRWAGAARARAGQFVFINAPQLAPLQWHPFSLSACDGAASLASVHALESGDWTRLLFAMAKAGHLNELRIDGPYGLPYAADLELEGADEVVVVAGGIGCTPLLALLQELAQQQHQQGQSGGITVRFLWTARSLALFEAFAPHLLALAESVIKPSVQLFVSGGEAEQGLNSSQQLLPFPLALRRCEDLDAELALLRADERDGEQPRRTIVLACGPESLVEDARQYALRNRLAFRSETFLL
jgi:NAD(P)H-flavin reductase